MPADLHAQLQTLVDRGVRAVSLMQGEAEADPVLLCATGAVGGETLDALDRAFTELRAMSSREALREHAIDQGFRLEDAIEVIARTSAPDIAAIERWLARRLSRSTSLTVAPAAPGDDLVLAAAFAGRVGASPTRTRYALERGRLRVEAFELHVTEHCNLRCSSCCNISPLVAERTMPADEVEAMCARMAEVVVADVFKIMGGEPLLHPEIARIIRAVRGTGLGDRVRLFTNGLLLKSMKEDFWGALDELTISNYVSAPVRPAILDLARHKSIEHGFVLNIKPVHEFSHVVSPACHKGDDAVRETFQRCWLRHRCLIVRGGSFYMCTRAAYAEDFLERVAHEPLPDGVTLDRSGDGVPLDAPDLASRLEAYMNRSEPLGACRYCFGGDGATEPHTQLSRIDVARGVLSRRLTRDAWHRS